VENILVLLSNPARPTLDTGTVQAIVEVLRSTDAKVGTPDWLAEGIACDIPFENPPGRGAPMDLGMTGIDAVTVTAQARRKKLLVADMESTMIENEMLDELADFLGLREKIAGITARAMNGEIDFEAALKARVELLKGLPVSTLDEAAKRIEYMPGGATLIATMKKNGAYCALVSGGFTYFTRMVREKLGFDVDAANTLTVAGTVLAGTVGMPILGKEAKLSTLQRLCSEHGLGLADAITVGDGANDLPMLQAAGQSGGLGVAFHAKPMVAAQVPARIHHGDLTALLYLQGYRRSDFIER
jgi:phosphoserine phosphatase